MATHPKFVRAHRETAGPRCVDEHRSEASYPPVDSDVVNIDATFCEEFFDIAIGQAVAEVPAHAPQRSAVTWAQFLRSQTAVACDFATVDTAMLRRYYVLFFIDVTSREVFFARITPNPTGPWTAQAARNLFLRHADRLIGAKALVRDRGSQFIDSFDEVFRTEGFKQQGELQTGGN